MRNATILAVASAVGFATLSACAGTKPAELRQRDVEYVSVCELKPVGQAEPSRIVNVFAIYTTDKLTYTALTDTSCLEKIISVGDNDASADESVAGFEQAEKSFCSQSHQGMCILKADIDAEVVIRNSPSGRPYASLRKVWGYKLRWK